MNSAEEQPDYCPHCRGLLEIVFVNFSLRAADMVVLARIAQSRSQAIGELASGLDAFGPRQRGSLK